MFLCLLPAGAFRFPHISSACNSTSDIITDSDGDDSGLWCVAMKITTMPSASVALT